MQFKSLRQMIHDAFMTDVKAIDIKALYEEGGIQFTAKGADGKIMDHVQKGYVQHALALQREQDPLSWAWNMFAYSPVGTAGSRERNILSSHALVSFASKHPDCPVPVAKIGMLARIAMHDISVEDVTGHRKRRKYEDLGRLFGISGELWQKEWHGHYVYFRGLFQALPAKSLPGLGGVIPSHVISDEWQG